MAKITEMAAGPLALDSLWLDEATSQANSSGYGAAGPFGWEDAAGIDFAAEVESVSRLFPHLDGLPSELTGDGLLGVAEQSAVCGGTSVALGAAGTTSSPGSPADPQPSPGDQCLMSPSDALLASPDPSLGSSPLGTSPSHAELRSAGDWKVATSSVPRSEIVHIQSDNAITDKITTLIDFVQPARAVSTKPPPAEEIFVSPSDLEMSMNKTTDTSSTEYPTGSPVEVTSPAAYETASGSPEEALSPEIEFLASSVEEDEHTRMIDQALEDLKTLESMCGITSEPTPSASSAASPASVTNTATTPRPAASSAAPTTPKPAATVTSIKEEPVDQDEDISIVEERPAARRRRRRPPRVAVTPAASPATQIVIMLTSEQLAGIQRSGQIVLNAAALQPSLAAAEALTSGGKAPQKAQASGKAPQKAHASGKARGKASQTVTKGQSGARSASVVRKVSSASSTITSASSTITSAASTNTSAASTSGTKAVKRPQVIVKQESAKRARIEGKSSVSSKDPLSGWMEQKLPPSGVGWDLPLLPAQALEQDLPLPADGGCIPEDLQDVLLDGPDAGAVPSLPADAADCLLEELISGSVRENPGLFDGVPPVGEVVKPAESVMPPQPLVEEVGQMVPPLQQQQGALGSPQPVLLAPAPIGFSLSPQQQPQQVALEPWSPTLCPSLDDSPISPSSECCSPELAPAPDWQPGPAARRGARKPRPYDKPARGGARRQPLTEEERRERKKEQNKNAATRYRQKKKVEHDLVSGDQEMLEARNKVLRERVGALSRELNYLKQLMREVLRHKQVSA
ncbi:actin cytoskeleton-regulatory complex protein PAN1-like [Amphibalanus amphitrite]|uniref:actin cytoskeleton-regulatory complex protein PAN1-like n=1 Tax=Amphibalanus amphitrite TaxID=1232801 RepID=UPI001C9027D0|nr:actin cytoskeleton-regulatory complex protein PAN1-like [Amphibalanus amphitrite]